MKTGIRYRRWTERELDAMRREYATTPDLHAFARRLHRKVRAVAMCASRLGLHRSADNVAAAKMQGVRAALEARGVADRSVVGLALRSASALEQAWGRAA